MQNEFSRFGPLYIQLVCQWCGERYFERLKVFVESLKAGGPEGQHYCQRSCYVAAQRSGLARRRLNYSLSPAAPRFWAKVNRHGPIPAHAPDLGACWLWTGATDPGGYGNFSVRRRPMKAHRFAYELATGALVPTGMVVLHRCDNPSCVRPEHLRIGTQKDNIHDMWAKGRHSPPPH